MSDDAIAVTGVWLRSTNDDRIEVLIEREGRWYLVIGEQVERVGGVLSHIVEPLGMRDAEPDTF